MRVESLLWGLVWISGLKGITAIPIVETALGPGFGNSESLLPAQAV